MGKRVLVQPGDKFNALTVIKEEPNKLVGGESRRVVKVKCSCGNVVDVLFRHLRNGNTTSCGCKGRKYITSENRVGHLRDIYSKINMSVLTTSIPHYKSNVEILCTKCLQITKKQFVSFCSPEHQKCKKCIEKQKRQAGTEEFKNKILEVLKNHENLTLVEDYNEIKYKGHVRLECSICKTIFERRVNYLLSYSKGCPCTTAGGFKQNLPGVLYLLAVKNKGNLICYKYGISNNKNHRFSMLKWKNSLEVDPIMYWYYEKGKFAKNHEAVLKRELKRALDKSDMSDGYTETIRTEDLESLLTIQSFQYKEYIRGYTTLS